MLIVGERINASIARVGEAIVAKDAAYIQRLARRQVEQGAHMLDANASTGRGDEVEDMAWLVQTIQAAVDVPLCIDSVNPAAMEAGLALHRGRALINSVSAEPGRIERILPLVKQYSAEVIGLTVGPKGVPQTTEDRVRNAGILVAAVQQYDIPLDALYVDPSVLPVSLDTKAPLAVLEAIAQIKARYGVKLILGLSNVSFGLPARRLINRTFLVLAMMQGLEAAVLDPLDRELMATLFAANALLGQDEFCAEYIRAFRQGRLETTTK